MNAKTVFYGLVVAVVGMVALGGTGYYFMAKALQGPVLETVHKKIELEQVSSNIKKIDSLRTELAQNKENIDRANAIVADTKLFGYQDKIIKDISRYAEMTNVKVIGFDFSAANTAVAPVKSGTAAPVAGGSATAAALDKAGVKKLTVTIHIAPPTQLDDYLRFLRAMELNLTKIQLTSVALTPDSTDPNLITASTVTVQIYVKK
jgi:hypothetical protein